MRYGLVVSLVVWSAAAGAQEVSASRTDLEWEAADATTAAPLPTAPRVDYKPPETQPAAAPTLPPPSELPAPPAITDTEESSMVGPPAPQGQWVFTQEYGWVWLPYGEAYTYVDSSYDLAQMYGYRAGIGWAWIASPWVFGYGATPYWGSYGYASYAWYARPWFHARYGYGFGSGYGGYRSGYNGHFVNNSHVPYGHASGGSWHYHGQTSRPFQGTTSPGHYAGHGPGRSIGGGRIGGSPGAFHGGAGHFGGGGHGGGHIGGGGHGGGGHGGGHHR